MGNSSEKSYKGLIGRIAWTVPTGDYGESESFFLYMTTVVLFAPLAAILFTALVVNVLPNTLPAFATIFIIALVVAEFVGVTLIFLASKLAEDENFAAYKARIEREQWESWKEQSDK